MKIPLTKSSFVAAAVLLALGIYSAHGQTAPAPAPAPGNGAEQGTVTLDPFNVTGDADVGFVAASSLAGGRIATLLKDTPVAYSVITKEFLDAFNITDMAQAANFSVNTDYYKGDGNAQGFGNGPAQQVSIRGRGANTPTRNFFPYANTSDSYNIDRIDFARGANAILFGAGGSGGTQNTGTKQATTARTIREVRTQFGSWNRYRFTADFNQPITDKFAVRTNLLWATGDTWRQHEWEDKVGFHVAGTYKLWPKLTLRGEYEYRSTHKLAGAALLQDRLSAWDGQFVSSGINPAMTASQLARAGVERFPLRFVTRPDFGGIVMNFQGDFRTKGAAYNANAANTNYLGGQPIKTVGLQLGKTAMIDVWNPDYRYAGASAGSPFRLPSRYESPVWDSPDHSLPTYNEYARDAALYLTYTPFESLFIEVAGDTNMSPRIGNNSARRGMQETFIDINRTLPNGVPNPHFLGRYSEYLIFEFQKKEMFDNLRTQVVYVKNTRVGKLQVGAMAGLQEQRSKERTQTVLIPATWLGPDYRTFVDSASDLNVYGDYTRYYHDETNRKHGYPPPRPVSVVDPVSNIRTIVTPTEVYMTQREDNNINGQRTFKFLQTVANLDLFKNHLVLIGAFRRDLTYVDQNRIISPADNPPGWDGIALKFRETPPPDYNELTYFPKNAAGQIIDGESPADNRPRAVVNNVNSGLPQYANDRFRDDYDAPAISASANTRTFGVVLNLTRWIGLYANDSTTFNLNLGALDVYGRVIPPTSSHGYDAGVRVTLPNGKLAVSLGWFSVSQDGSSFKLGDGFPGAYNNISDAPIVGDLSSSGRNIRGLRRFPTNVNSTRSTGAHGYEVEMTANLTPSWRLILNAGTNGSFSKNSNPDILPFIEERDPLVRQILADAGILIDPQSKQAFINPALDDPTKINVERVQRSADAWNSLQNEVIPTFGTKASAQSKQSATNKWVGNLATDYRFRSGRLSGLRVGLGINYRGKRSVGDRAGDTIVNPNNPAQAIDDPTVDGNTEVFVPAYYMGTGTLSYTVRLKESRRYFPRSIQFDLAIDNLFGRGAPVYGSSGSTSNAFSAPTFMAPRNNDISNPSVVSIPGNMTYMPPRNFMLSAKMDF